MPKWKSCYLQGAITADEQTYSDAWVESFLQQLHTAAFRSRCSCAVDREDVLGASLCWRWHLLCSYLMPANRIQKASENRNK